MGSAADGQVATDEDLRQLRGLLKRHRHAKVDWAFSYSLRPRCPAGKEKIALTCYGDVLGCTLNHMSFGNVREEPLEEIWNRAGRFSAFARNADRCLAAFDRSYQRAYLLPVAQAESSPVRFDGHPGITPSSEPALFSAPRDAVRRFAARALWQAAWPRVAAVLIRLTQQFGPRVVKVRAHTFAVPRQVFNPKLYLTSQFMARHMQVRPCDDVLDVGTGSGVLAVVAAETARSVLAVDISPAAVECARANVRRNGFDRVVRVQQGDLFASLSSGERFDTILFSPPYFEGTVRSAFDRALYDPGKALAARFFAQAGRYLKEGGCVQMVYSSAAEPERMLAEAARLGWRWSVVAEKRARFESLYVYRLTPDPSRRGAESALPLAATPGVPASSIGGIGLCI